MEWNIKDYIFLATFTITLASGLITIGGLIYSLREVIKDVEELRKELLAHKDNLSKHTGDTEAHVNHLHMRSIDSRLGKLETSVENGNKRIEEKIDRLSEKLYERK